jgi:hypothetical protein
MGTVRRAPSIPKTAALVRAIAWLSLNGLTGCILMYIKCAFLFDRQEQGVRENVRPLRHGN